MKVEINTKSKILAVTLIVSVFLIFTSCNLFLSLPRGRENLNDPAAQITAFTAVPSGDKSIVTMWNWKDPSNWVGMDERIDEIKIMHSITGYPDINFPFIGQKYDNNSAWQYEWDSLIGRITHYFALYAKDNKGTWYAPIRAKAKLPGTLESGISYYIKKSLIIDGGPVVLNPDPLSIDNWNWAVVHFDLPEDIFIVNATINVSVGALTEITFAALDGSLPNDDWEKWDWLQNGWIVNEAASMTFNASSAFYDITEVIRAAAIGSEKAILIKTTDGSSFNIVNNALTPYIIADIIK
jgi:hypothetical protein